MAKKRRSISFDPDDEITLKNEAKKLTEGNLSVLVRRIIREYCAKARHREANEAQG